MIWITLLDYTIYSFKIRNYTVLNIQCMSIVKLVLSLIFKIVQLSYCIIMKNYDTKIIHYNFCIGPWPVHL